MRWRIKQKFKYLLSGFGRTEQELQAFVDNPDEDTVQDFLMDVYSIPSFCFSVGEFSLTWKNLEVAIAVKEGIGADLILPSTMFRGMVLQWDQEDTEKPYIEIRSKVSIKYVFVQKYLPKLRGKELLKYIYSQDTLDSIE